ncbi:MAG: hypothetical protein ACUVTD_04390 [Nitrososphaerales archaeon]
MPSVLSMVMAGSIQDVLSSASCDKLSDDMRREFGNAQAFFQQAVHILRQ